MKKNYILAFLLLTAGIVSSKEVEKNIAIQVAKNFYQQAAHRSITDDALSLAYEAKTQTNEPAYFVYNLSDKKGFVIISGDDLVEPILAYSASGNFNPADVPPPVKAWLEGYANQIGYVKKNNTSTTIEITGQWNNYFSNTLPDYSTTRTSSVNPLCNTQWNQAPNENGMCPFDQAHNENCVTGCPATAMAQIMKFWEYPTQGTGFHSYNEQHYGTLSANFGSTTYDWAGMPNVLNSPDNEVALLMFHCGVAVEMNYGVGSTGGSGSYVCIDYSPTVEQTCENAFKTYFGYDPTISGKLRSNFTDAAWTNLAKGELDASRPIQYAGFGNGGGHTWVCDGYDQNNLFHMNWGWGGNSDGYFSLDNLDPTSLGAGGGTGGFNNNQQMLVGIKPLGGGGGGGGGGTVNQDGISLHAAITVSANPVQVDDPFSVYTEIQNTGTNNFNGDIAAALFNSDGVFLTFIEEITNVTMDAGFYYTVQFDMANISVIPGQCIVGVFYKNGSNEYSLVGQSTFNNPVGITVTGYYTDLQMYSNSTVNPTIPQVNQSFSISTQLANIGGSDFNGWLSADLYTMEGDYVTNIQELSGEYMQAGFFYTKNFTTAGLTVDPGTYYVAFWASADHTSWDFFYNANYPNPITVVITGQTLSPDSYENDDTEASAHVFPVNFAGNSADVVTTGSNIHQADDLDYYKINLPAGNGYVIEARADDSYQSMTGVYTNDVLFSFSINGSSYSDIYDDVMTPPTTVPNGGSVIFAVANYFAGTTGTYQLNLHITKTGVGIADIESSPLVLYPNPASKSFRIDAIDLYGNYQLRIYNILGEIVKEVNDFADHSVIETDIRDLQAGFYDVRLTTGKGLYNSRLVVE